MTVPKSLAVVADFVIKVIVAGCRFSNLGRRGYRAEFLHFLRSIKKPVADLHRVRRDWPGIHNLCGRYDLFRILFDN